MNKFKVFAFGFWMSTTCTGVLYVLITGDKLPISYLPVYCIALILWIIAIFTGQDDGRAKLEIVGDSSSDLFVQNLSRTEAKDCLAYITDWYVYDNLSRKYRPHTGFSGPVQLIWRWPTAPKRKIFKSLNINKKEKCILELIYWAWSASEGEFISINCDSDSIEGIQLDFPIDGYYRARVVISGDNANSVGKWVDIDCETERPVWLKKHGSE